MLPVLPYFIDIYAKIEVKLHFWHIAWAKVPKWEFDFDFK